MEDEHSTATGVPRVYTVRELKAPLELLPGVDPMRKEIHLSDEDFIELFRCTKEHFSTLPKWRQMLLKKQHGLH
jgi:hypothetical protein